MNFERFQQIISEEFNMDLSKIHGDIEFRNMESWSSLHALLFIARINDEEGVMLTSSDLTNCKTLREIHELIVRR